MVTGFILPAIAALLLIIAFKSTEGLHLAKIVATVSLVAILVLYRSFAWASTASFGLLVLLIFGLVGLIVYSLLME